MAVDYKDYYKVLGVSRDADQKAIRQAYRKLARQYHPDVNPNDKAAEEKFKEINEANEALSDPEKRKKYDEMLDYYQRFGHWPGTEQAAGAGRRAGQVDPREARPPEVEPGEARTRETFDRLVGREPSRATPVRFGRQQCEKSKETPQALRRPWRPHSRS